MRVSLGASIRSDVTSLGADLAGRVVTAEDPDYDALRTVMSGAFDVRPAAIVRAANAGDIGRVVSFARDRDLELAVRSGGHSAAGHSTLQDGLVLDLRDLRSFELDPGARTVWAGSGLSAGEYTSLAAQHGLATGFGDTASVGLGGITLGGGVGYLVRKYGLTIDSLLAAEIVTADGQLHEIDAAREPDLFWAIRGGGGNLGIVTRFKFQLQALPSVVGGMLILPASAEVIAGFIAAAATAPDELSTIANVMPCPPMPFVPAEHHGALVILGMLCFAGDAEAGEQAMAPFRALARPVVDMVKPMPYPEMYPPDDDSYHPTAVSQTMFMDQIGEPEAREIVARLSASDASMRVAQLRVLGGALARVPRDATAFAHRDQRIMVNLAAFYDGQDDRPVRAAWVDDFRSALQQGTPAAYVNFLGDEGEARVREAYPGPTWDRLAAVKRQYDPTNLFSRNQNVPPAQT